MASSWLSHTQLPHLTATPPQAPAFNSNCLSLYLHIMLFTICLTDIEPWHQRLTTSAPLHIGPLPFTPFLSLAPHATLSTWSWTGLMKAGLSGPQICDQAHATCKYADGAHCCMSSLPPYVSNTGRHTPTYPYIVFSLLSHSAPVCIPRKSNVKLTVILMSIRSSSLTVPWVLSTSASHWYVDALSSKYARRLRW